MFDTPEARQLNAARLAHLDSLELPLRGKTVVDAGCGVGHLASELLKRGCLAVCVDARAENIERLRSRCPELTAYVANVEKDPLSRFGVFDIVFSYGLLYHLENPFAALRNMESACKELLLVETYVCDHRYPILRIEDETLSFNQSLGGIGSRPSPSYVVVALNRIGFRHVYAPRVPPRHPDFEFDWRNNLDISRDGHNLRCVFVASRTQLQNPNLVALF